VNKYVTHFTQLSCYAPTNVDTDKKKQDYFLNGLNDGLAYALEARNYENFQDMVNKALVLENRRSINSRPRVGIPSVEPIQRTPQQEPRTQFQHRLQKTMQGF
jgi:hypothetical protein